VFSSRFAESNQSPELKENTRSKRHVLERPKCMQLGFKEAESHFVGYYETRMFIRLSVFELSRNNQELFILCDV